MERGFWSLFIILVAGLLGSLWLEMSLWSHFVLELYVLIIGVLISIVVIAGVAWDTDWGWPLATVLLAGMSLNALVVYLASQTSTFAFIIVLLVCLTGLVNAFMRSTEPAEDALDELPQMEFERRQKRRRR